MRLFFIRHGDPDYTTDGLTKKGENEALILSKHIKELDLDDIYVSPLGRAAKTAGYSLDILGKNAVTLDWLREFPDCFDPNRADAKTAAAYLNELKKDPVTGLYEKRITWDILPSYHNAHPELFDAATWKDTDLVKASDMEKIYTDVTASFDSLLSDYGYERHENIYHVRKSSNRRIGFFCHFGITCVLLSHLWNISPFVLLTYMAMAPTSVTEVVTEEREKGISIFRALRIGDISHLTMEKEPPAFAARFCECFDNSDERH